MSVSEKNQEFDVIEFDIDAASGGSSGEAFSPRPQRRVETKAASDAAADATESTIFKLLAAPKLPELKHDARARLMMQSPNRLYFYWSIDSHSFQALHKTLGGSTGDYRLAFRLLNLTTDAEELHAVEPDGNWWFTVTPDNEYRAEIGFFSASRPFVRILFSNTIATPRKAPSPHSANEARWAVTTHAFAEMLEASGFEGDAYAVVRSSSSEGLRASFAAHVGIDEKTLSSFDPNEMQHALLLLASGIPIEDLKWKITAELYALLQAHLNSLTPGAIEKGLGISAASEDTEFETFSAVGGSFVNFPRRKYKPVSSISLH
jgi:hypothetical protein